MKIAFIDSGVGGLNVLFRLASIKPQYQYLYIADNLYAPYGSHSNNNLVKRLTCLIHALEGKVDAVVLACNTASLVLKDVLKEFLMPVVTVTPDVKDGRDSVVLATPLSMQVLVETLEGVPIVACPHLATTVEHSVEEGAKIDADLYTVLRPYRKVKKCYLACTHYVYAKKALKKVLKRAKFFDGIDTAIAKVLALKGAETQQKGSISIFFTGAKEVEKYQKIIKNCFKPKLPIAFVSIL